MSRDHSQPPAGSIGYIQLPTRDLDASITFYANVFGWKGEKGFGSFEAPGLIGQWTRDLAPAADDGPLLWLMADDLFHTLEQVEEHAGKVRRAPMLDQGERWLVEVDDPAGNRLGIVVPARTARPQTMLMVRDVQASSRWYQQLLGLTSDHGGSEYERLLSDGELVLQLHHDTTEHHHGAIGDPEQVRGNGVLIWFGEVSDFAGVLQRADELGAPVVKPVHRNPPEGDGNGPAHREIWLQDPDGYTVAVASPDGEAWRA